MASTLYADWDFRGQRLEQKLEAADFVTSDSTLMLASKKAVFSADAVKEAICVGLVQDMSFSQSRQVTQVFEIGSNQKYTLSSGRTTGQISISRMLFDGMSLLKVFQPEGKAASAKDAPGAGEMNLNLASSFFSRPMGIILVFRDLESQNVGATFFEEAFVVSHNMSISSNSPFIGENVSMLYNSSYPLSFNGGEIEPGQGGAADGSG